MGSRIWQPGKADLSDSRVLNTSPPKKGIVPFYWSTLAKQTAKGANLPVIFVIKLVILKQL